MLVVIVTLVALCVPAAVTVVLISRDKQRRADALKALDRLLRFLTDLFRRQP